MINKPFFFVLVALLLSVEPLYSSTCYARLDGETLFIGNALVERSFQWNSGLLKTLSLVDKDGSINVRLKSKNSFCVYEYSLTP